MHFKCGSGLARDGASKLRAHFSDNAHILNYETGMPLLDRSS
jgi:hypothetical protein